MLDHASQEFPQFLFTELYDMDAKAARPSTPDELHEMFRTLLADRFQLRFHGETKEIPAYVLTVAKSGPRLKRSESNEAFDVPIKPGGPGRFVGTRVAMSYLAWYLSQQLGAPVVDWTVLDGFYDFTVSWSPDPGLGPDGHNSAWAVDIRRPNVWKFTRHLASCSPSNLSPAWADVAAGFIRIG